MRKVTIAALAILGLQLCEIVVLGPSPAGSLTGVGLETAAAALAAMMCFRASRRAQGMARPFWVLVGIGIATQCFTNILYGYYEASGHLIRAANIFLPIAILSRAFFFAMALFLDPHKDSSRVDAEVLIDYAQLAIVFSLVFLYFGYVPSNSSLFWTPPIARAVQ